MRGPQALPGNHLQGVIAAEIRHRAAQAAVADRSAAVGTLAQIARA